MKENPNQLSRRGFIQSLAMAGMGAAAFPYINCGNLGVKNPMKRILGRIPFEATTLGLGGQGTLQWPARKLDPVQIVMKAFKLGLNYFDTSNLYQDSQYYYNKAFQKLNLIPGKADYDERLRRSIFITSKTHLRWGKRSAVMEDGVHNWSDGEFCRTAIDDLKRSLSILFGDGRGNYPEDAYLDMFMVHSVSTPEDVEALYEGYELTDPAAERIGALAVLFDYRDGTNRTGENPRRIKLIRHIGLSGHYSAPVLMDMIQRDRFNILDGLLVAVNANDRLYCNMQYNVLPIAIARNMGVIGMKAFADGAMYNKEAIWSENYQHVIRRIGQKPVPFRQLLQYTLTTPGVNIAVTGIGYTDMDPRKCQLMQNLSAAQVLPDGLTQADRKKIEQMASSIKDGKTNYFQMESIGLTPPRDIAIYQERQNLQRVVQLHMNTAIAGRDPIHHYEIWRDNQRIAEIPFEPQTTKKPIIYTDTPGDELHHFYKFFSVDAAGQSVCTDDILCEKFV